MNIFNAENIFAFPCWFQAGLLIEVDQAILLKYLCIPADIQSFIICIKRKKLLLPGGESNPGLPRDRRGYLPLYYRGVTKCDVKVDHNSTIAKQNTSAVQCRCNHRGSSRYICLLKFWPPLYYNTSLIFFLQICKLHTCAFKFNNLPGRDEPLWTI